MKILDNFLPESSTFPVLIYGDLNIMAEGKSSKGISLTLGFSSQAYFVALII